MLYDPKWEQKTKADPLSLDALIAWLEKQPADEVYFYMHTGECLAAQYNRSIGRQYEIGRLISRPDDDAEFDCDLENIACRWPHTFGAALKRARELAAHQ